VEQYLVARELMRARWSKEHGSVDKSLSATVLARLIAEERAKGTDTDRRMMELVRSVVREEFDAGGGVTGS
jgi:hypothetical protein